MTAAWGGGARVGVRFSPWNGYNDMADSDPARAFPVFGRAIAEFGLAYVHVIEPVDAETSIAREISAAAEAPLIVNGGYDGPAAETAVASGAADAVSFAKWYIANPDLPERLSAGVTLAEPDKATIYGGDAKGYTDYPVARQA